MTRAEVRNTKKALLIIEVVLIMVLLSACQDLRWVFINEDVEAEKVAQQVITAIENKDEQALSDLFSQKALTDANDFDEGLNYVFSLYKGNLLGIEKGYVNESAHFEQHHNKKWVDARYTVTTTEGVYCLNFEYALIDEASPEAEGIYSLWFYEDERIREINELGGMRYQAGIYHPGWDTEAIKEE